MNFKYRARTSDGEITEGYIEADSQKNALNSLRSRGMIVINLNSNKPDKIPVKSVINRITHAKIPTKNLMIFFRQLATMVQAGLNISSAFEIICAQEKNKSFKNSLLNIKNMLERGVSLSQAMSQHNEFNALIISLVEAGEEGGLLDTALEQVATLLEKQENLKNKIHNALFYPTFVIIFALVVAGVFFMYLVPKFKSVFESMNIELPAMTANLFNFGEYVINNYKLILISGLGIIFLIWILFSGKFAKNFMDRFKLKIPVLKNLIFKSSMARATRILSALISAGVPVIRSLEMAENTAENIVIREGFEELRHGASRGVSLGDASKQAGIFPVLISQMMRIGEETGHLDNMLERVASWYDQEVDTQIKNTVSLLEPVMIIFVGLIVGVIALSIFGPVTSAMSQIM